MRQFTKSGASVIHPNVAKVVWQLCLPYSEAASEEILEPDALFNFLFHNESDNGVSNDQIIRGAIMQPDEILNNHPETTGDSFRTENQKEQQKLMLPPPPPGSFKKIIAHPTRTMLTVPANFDQSLVQASSRLPNYDCSV